MIGPVADLLDGYGDAGTWDEMFRDPDEPRPAYRALHDTVLTLSAEEFDERCRLRDDLLRDQGITFSLSGEERPLPLDLVPRIITSDEWSVIERGVAQRVRALEAFLDDVYGRGEIMADRVVPRRLVTSSTHYQRAAAGIRPPNGVRVHVAGIDLVRDEHGVFRVLEDNLRTPVGHLLRGREPPDDDPRAARAVRPAAGPAGHRVPDQAPARAARLRAAGRRRPDRGRAHARRLQLRPLRARLPRPPDGRRAGRGPRPAVPRRPRVDAHHRGPAAGST